MKIYVLIVVKCILNTLLGRFSTVILFGHECAWNPDNEYKEFVKSTLKKSGYVLLDFGYEQLSENC